MLSKILVSTRAERDFSDLIALLSEHNKLFLGVLWGALWLIKASEQLAAELDLPRRQSFKVFWRGHNLEYILCIDKGQ